MNALKVAIEKYENIPLEINQNWFVIEMTSYRNMFYGNDIRNISLVQKYSKNVVVLKPHLVRSYTVNCLLSNEWNSW